MSTFYVLMYAFSTSFTASTCAIAAVALMPWIRGSLAARKRSVVCGQNLGVPRAG